MADEKWIKWLEKRNKYIEKQEYYRKKVLDLDAKYFEQINKDNKFLKQMRKESE